jgi:hypothetical protein
MMKTQKPKVIIYVFEHVIGEGLNEIEQIYHYYDVFSELRYSDILMLVKDYMPYEISGILHHYRNLSFFQRLYTFLK